MKKILCIFTILIILLTTSCVGRSGPSGIDDRFVKSITVLKEESVLEFFQGEFDPSLIKIYVEKANEKHENINVTMEMIKTDLTKLVVGQNTIMCEYLLDANNSTEPYKFFITITIKEKADPRFSYRADQLNLNYYIDGYMGNDEIVNLPASYNGKPVIGVLDSAFLNNQTLKVVNIPEGYTTIETAAFYQCPNLVSIYVPSTVKSIGDYALNGIRTIFLGGTINTNWSSKWFDEKASYVYENIGFEHLVIENEFQYLLDGESVILANYLGTEKEIDLPSTFNNLPVETIGAYAFGLDKNIEKIVMPNSIKTIMNNAFNNCENLETVTLSVNLEVIEASAFCYCSNMQDIILPDKLTFIGDGAFNMCTSLTKIVIPRSVKTIEYYAFAWCTGLKELYIHDTLENFGQGAIYSCSKLTVYTEYESIPSTWNEGFNPSNRPIKFNQAI